ncbi:hypothetical protein CVT26_005135 [Gymnopilus dilepis]|uniref:Rad60/SUMO-like domain-containing protein n=1 Tax=Gymnopilus dilepis TaxID=231916 RepID=A0A409YTH7_9AGAR|nr:hypothetical protein CVT26_005135 [Gymnopilus dilepis]
MSQEPEDVKPKLNLNIAFDGTQITVKVKANMKFAKIFEAAEKRFGKDPGMMMVVLASLLFQQLHVSAIGTLRFTYEGNRVQPTQTPAELEMEDGDQIDAFLQQFDL